MDFHRPTYHLTPPKNWMNDPNGAIQWKGKYHLFYQYNPHAAVSATKHWGHAVSDDLLTWEHLPIALTPEAGRYDKNGCFSGCMVVNNGVPTIIYTGVKPEVQCLATSSDDLLTWKKYPGNPVLSKFPDDMNLRTFRDPYVWKEEEGLWYMLLGSGTRESGGLCLLYRSSDLINWEYLHPLMKGNRVETGLVWNCPNFFKLEGQHILIVSGQPVWKPFYWTGIYSDHQFSPQHSGLVDYGGCLYAGLVFHDENNRPIYWGWIWESRTDAEILAAGWAGVMALPRIPFLNPHGGLGFKPAPETEKLRQNKITIPEENYAFHRGSQTVSILQGAALEIKLTLEPGNSRDLGIQVLSALDQSEYTRIGFNLKNNELYLDRSQANLSPTMFFNWPNPNYHTAPLNLQQDEPLTLHIFIDHSVIEVYTPSGIVISSRVYTSTPQCDHVFLYADEENSRVLSLEAWKL
ncbi:MAG: glycosyl hydrolase family 32 [Anaerolineaceae bacterium]|jgi:beta-fructofuranosidase|nr:glycosyl hydrolase family 32 [Anaerolineaceae bacterium]